MDFAYLSGRVAPRALDAALDADLVFASSDAVFILRDGAETASPSRLARRGVRHLAYRLALYPEVPAVTAFEEGWIDGVGSRDEIDNSLSGAALSLAARTAGARRMSFPSRAGSLAIERAEFALLNAIQDKHEGIRAFFEKRSPRFSDR